MISNRLSAPSGARSLVGWKLLAGIVLSIGCLASLAATDIVFPADSGVIDVTKAPYFAKGDGRTDDTAALNKALADYNSERATDPFMTWTIYLPAGTYLVSDTIQPLKSAGGNKAASAVRIVGQGVDRTTIRLQDRAPRFSNPDRARYVLRTGSRAKLPNSGFGNYIQHLTVDVGEGNPGAIGVRFDVANCGAMKHVAIRSTDPAGAGKYGLGIFGSAGPGYIADVSVEGFDVGMYFDETSVNNFTLEHIELRNQRVAGLVNVNKNLAIRRLESDNEVPAVRADGPSAVTIVVDSELRGAGDGAAIALDDASFLYLRNVRQSGYGQMVDLPPEIGGRDLTDSAISEWWSHDAEFMEGVAASSLGLPIEEAPEYVSADLGEWTNVTAFGAVPDDGKDDAAAIQKAIDSSGAVLYFPRGVYDLGSDVEIRGSVRKIDFLFSKVKRRPNSGASLVIGEVAGDFVELANVSARLDIVHDSDKAVVIRNRATAGRILTGPHASGDLFVENAGPHVEIRVANGIHAWLRSIDRGRMGFTNEASTAWYFGDNVERMQAKKTGNKTVNPLRTIRGTTELIGGGLDALWTRHSKSDGALIESIDSEVSATYAGDLRLGMGAGWGSWPLHVRETGSDGKRLIEQSEVVFLPQASPRARRFVVPLYRSE